MSSLASSLALDPAQPLIAWPLQVNGLCSWPMGQVMEEDLKECPEVLRYMQDVNLYRVRGDIVEVDVARSDRPQGN